MDFEEIVSILSAKIPMTDISVGNVLVAILVLLIGYLIVTVVVRYIRHAMNKANMAKLLVEFVSRVAKIMLLIVIFAHIHKCSRY